ncbi:hypothetical protein [Kiloniella majae]|uniref:hypothetical protein n=1 Tax=Kiloniella majae TaxID=1938558 RepID=UPI000A2774C2|nr:hypothetical protein [Kiloniella majae]
MPNQYLHLQYLHRAKGAKPNRTQQRGYALLMVLLGLVLLGLVAARFGTLASTDIKVVRNMGQTAKIEAMVDSALLRVIDGLMQDKAAGFWRADGSRYQWQEQQFEITATISDQALRPDDTQNPAPTDTNEQSNKRLAEPESNIWQTAKTLRIERLNTGNGLKLSERAIAHIELSIKNLEENNTRQKMVKVRLTGPRQKPFQILGEEVPEK